MNSDFRLNNSKALKHWNRIRTDFRNYSMKTSSKTMSPLISV